MQRIEKILMREVFPAIILPAFALNIISKTPYELDMIDLWSPAGKGLTSWLSFVMSNYEAVTFSWVSWARCGT